MGSKRIVMTRQDMDRLRLVVNDAIISGRSRHELDGLVGELDRALIVAPEEVPNDVVTMNSKMRLVDAATGDTMEMSLVFPEDADPAGGTVSILAPVGTAIIGYSEGDSIEWPTPSGVRTYKIEKVLFQPEAAGEWEL